MPENDSASLLFFFFFLTEVPRTQPLGSPHDPVYCPGQALCQNGKSYLFFHLVIENLGRQALGKQSTAQRQPSYSQVSVFAWLLMKAVDWGYCGICFALPIFLFALWQGGSQPPRVTEMLWVQPNPSPAIKDTPAHPPTYTSIQAIFSCPLSMRLETWNEIQRKLWEFAFGIQLLPGRSALGPQEYSFAHCFIRFPGSPL